MTDFEVQYRDGPGWATIPGGLVSNNSKVWRRFTFNPMTTPAIRVVVTGALGNYSRIVEVEAWTHPPGMLPLRIHLPLIRSKT